jgi:hypothetical protein
MDLADGFYGINLAPSHIPALDLALSNLPHEPPCVCPVKALIRRVLYLCQHQSPPTTPLCTVYTNHTLPSNVSSVQLTAALCCSATFLFPITGFSHAKVSAGALRDGGTMALLSAHVDDNVIKIGGRWRSAQML